MMYYMNWVLTNAQIELIASDVSVVDYGNVDDGKKKRKRGEFDNTKANPDAVRRANENWIKKYGNEKDAGAGLSIKDILGNSAKTDVGVKLE